MSTIYRDRISVDRARWAGASATYQLFKKSWGTTTVDGIEVFNKTMVYWAGGMTLNATQKRFIKKIGLSYEQLSSQKYEGLDNAYFKLDSAKYTYEPMDTAQIAADLEMAFAVGDEFEVAVTYGGDLKRYTSTFMQPDGTGGYTVDTVGIRSMLNSDRVKYFANASTTAAGSMFQETETSIYDISVGTNKTPISTPVTRLAYNDSDTGNGKLYDCLAMLDNGTTFQEIGINTERVQAVETTDQYGNVVVIGEYSYTVKFRVIATPLVSSYITTQCSIVANAMKTSMLYRGSFNLKLTNHSQDTLIKQAVLLMSNDSSHPAFYNGYLRADYCAAIKRKDFVKILGKVIGTGYTKKKTNIWKKVLAIVIIVIAIVIIVLTWWTGVGNVAGMTLASLGAGLLYGSGFLSLALIAYAEANPEATDMIKIIGGAATIVGYASAVVSVWSVATTSSNLMQQASAALQVGAIVASVAGDKELAAILKIGAMATGYAGAQDAFKAWTFEGPTTFSDAVANLATGAVESLKELPQAILDKISSITTTGVLTDVSSISLGQVGGWMQNMTTAMQMYNQFFVTPYIPPTNSEHQSDKESGVEEYIATQNMVDNTDLLDRISQYKENMFGGQQTQMYMSSIA